MNKQSCTPGMLCMILELYEKLNYKFTTQEKDECVLIVPRVMELEIKVRVNGLLSLGAVIADMKEEKDFFLKIALQYAIDSSILQIPLSKTALTYSTWSNMLEEIMVTIIMADWREGAELLSRLMITQGVMSMVDGERAKQICYRLFGMLGEDYLKKAEDYESICNSIDNTVLTDRYFGNLKKNTINGV